MSMVFKASPRRRLGVQVASETRRRGRLTKLGYGVRLGAPGRRLAAQKREADGLSRGPPLGFQHKAEK
uniref:Uncharacterized protein n=1 Tax=Arundo donax TaxID=35708 RepID=A0A0A9B761_ARUDO